MSWDVLLTILAVAVALGADAFSLCMGISMVGGARTNARRWFVAVVTVLHIAMPLLGLKLGTWAGSFLGRFASYVGAAVLIYIAWHMSKDVLPWRRKQWKFSEARQVLEPSKGVKLDSPGAVMILALSVSMDALTVGFSLGTMNVPIILSAVVMGITAGTMTALGFASGRLASRAVGDRAQIAGAIILVVLAVKMLF
ncbi:MAG: manganese efflux pump MntP family protein [Methylocystaceae bacterium]